MSESSLKYYERHQTLIEDVIGKSIDEALSTQPENPIVTIAAALLKRCKVESAADATLLRSAASSLGMGAAEQFNVLRHGHSSEPTPGLLEGPLRPNEYYERHKTLIEDVIGASIDEALSTQPENPIVTIAAALLKRCKVESAADATLLRSAASSLGAAEQVRVLPARATPDEEEGERIVLWFIKADKLRGCDDRVLPRFQDLQRQRPDWFEEKEITLEGACKHEYADEVLAVAHRWEQPAEPDTQGKQFAAMCAYVRGKPAIKLVWVDFSCAPQKERTPAEELVFKRTLRFVSLLFLGSRVLILCDRTYMTRFWTLLEAWISMQMATDDGLVPAPREKRRCDIVPIHDASSVTVSELEALVAGKSLDQIHEMLESPDISVTNLNDKNTQLPKLLALDSQVGQVVRKMAPPPKLTLAGGAPRPSRGVAGVGTGADAPAAPSKDERLQRLIQQVRSGSADAAGALADMGDNESRVAIARAGGIAPLVTLVKSGTDDQKEYAAAALWNLAYDNVENQVLIAQAGAITPLVTLVQSGTDGQKENATGALQSLFIASPASPVGSQVASSGKGASVALAQRPAHADYAHYFAEWDGRDAQGLEGDASASVLELPHGVELRSRGGPLRADMFRVELIPSDHRLAAGALSEVLHIIAPAAGTAAGTAAGPATDGEVPYPLLLRMPHRASAEQLEQLAFYRAETPDSEMQLVEGGCFWSDGYAEVEVTSFSVWKVAPLLLGAAAVGWAMSTRTYIDRPVGVAAFAPSDPEAPRILRFVLHPKQDPPPDNHYVGFCKVGDDKEVAVCRGKAVTIALKDDPELGVRFAPWRNTRQSEIMPRVLELGPSSSHSSLRWAFISQPGVVPHQREFPLMLPTAAAAVPEASRASSAQSSSSPSRASSAQSGFYPSRASSAHLAQLMMSMPLPDTWDAEAGADVEQPRLVEVPHSAQPNSEFEHVASLLAKGLPGASILGLKRVQNARLWRKYAVECHEIALKNGGQSNERELWHSTGDTPADVVCMSEHGFDPTYSIGTALRGSGTDGNKYGIGVYFAEHALYSDVMRPSVAQEGGKEIKEIVLAKVVLGNVKDFGAELAPDLLREPIDERTGIAYDSWTGTEKNLIGVTEIEAVRLSGSPSAKRAQLLVDEGHKYGRQYIVCRYQKAYPAYVVRYEVLQDALSGAPPTPPALIPQQTIVAPQLGAPSSDVTI
jgi:hypothetical protein